MNTLEDKERDKREDETEKRIFRQWRKRMFPSNKDKDDFPDPESDTHH